MTCDNPNSMYIFFFWLNFYTTLYIIFTWYIVYQFNTGHICWTWFWNQLQQVTISDVNIYFERPYTVWLQSYIHIQPYGESLGVSLGFIDTCMPLPILMPGWKELLWEWHLDQEFFKGTLARVRAGITQFWSKQTRHQP